MVSNAHVFGVVEHIGSGKGNLGRGLVGSRWMLVLLMAALAKSADLDFVADGNDRFVVVQASVPLNSMHRSRQVKHSEYLTAMLNFGG